MPLKSNTLVSKLSIEVLSHEPFVVVALLANWAKVLSAPFWVFARPPVGELYGIIFCYSVIPRVLILFGVFYD